MENRRGPSPSPRPLPRGEGEPTNASSAFGKCWLLIPRIEAKRRGVSTNNYTTERPGALSSSRRAEWFSFLLRECGEEVSRFYDQDLDDLELG